MPRAFPPANAPASERTFDAQRNQTVRTRTPGITADFSLPELQDLRRLRPRTPQQHPAEALASGASDRPLASAQPKAQEYDYDPIYGQLGAGYLSGGVFPWEPGMGFGTQTPPTALGYRRVPRGAR